jgi:tRNA dimethylallyltransferase
VALLGPTAVGKSDLALALCDRFDGEIISVDSAQVYRGMDIGSAKPGAACRARFAHHLIDIRDAAETYSAAEFGRDALAALQAVQSRGRLPILVGGTFLYFRALSRGLSDLPPADPQLRARLLRDAEAQGWPALHARLAQADPPSAQRIHPNDAQRIQRALEILELSGAAPSVLYSRRAPAWDGRIVAVGLVPGDRVALHRRIDQRLQQMMRAGFLEEVAGLRARPELNADLPSMRAVGYRQLWRHLDGERSLPQAVAEALAATRQLAKRQLSWLRSEELDSVVDPLEPERAKRVLEGLCQRVREGAW